MPMKNPPHPGSLIKADIDELGLYWVRRNGRPQGSPLQARTFYTCNSTISGFNSIPATATRASVTGSRNRRGPAEPGLR
jgi:hypothetical protein